MAARLESIQWTDQRSISEIVEGAKGCGVDYLVIHARPEAMPTEFIQQSVLQNPSASMIAFVDPNHPARNPRLTSLLPAIISFIAARPEQDLAIAISVQTWPSPALACDCSQSLCEFVVRNRCRVLCRDSACFNGIRGASLDCISGPDPIRLDARDR
jgi:hypothetical protein